jgi:hypothetical protein
VIFAKKAMKNAAFKSDFAKWGYLNDFFKDEYFDEINDIFAGL